MRSSARRACAVMSGLAASFIMAGCENKKGDETSATTSVEAPVLNEAARNQAVAMIAGDLNAPLVELQAVLTNAAQDGRIEPNELQIQGASGSIPVDWWLWNKGYLRLEDDEYYGPYLALSEKGAGFVGGAAPAWLTAKAEGSPKMDCQSAGGLTRAVCTANVAYSVSQTPGGDLARVVVPASSANMEASFTQGEGWSVTQLSVDGEPPRDVARSAIFGTPEMAVEPRRQFFEAITKQLERRAAAQQRQEAAAQPSTYSPADIPPPAAASLAKSSASSAPVIVNARVLRRPTDAELMAVYPARALNQGILGRATMTCTSTAQGSLTGCMAMSESPPGQRFGQAAVALASRYRISPRTIDGQPVDSSVSLDLSWTLD